MKEERKVTEESYFIGELMFIIFQNEHENFTIAKFKVIETNEEFEEDEIVAKGYFANLNEGTSYFFHGQVEYHSTYGQQYNVSSYQLYIPDNETGLIDYLSSDFFPGIGPKTAKRIVDHLGEDAINRIINDPKTLDEIPHLNKKVKEKLINTLKANQGFDTVVTQLSRFNIGLKMSQRIFKEYKGEAFDLIKTDPYEFVFTIEGFGFKSADKIALHNGLSLTHGNRIGAACIYIMQEAVKDGHVFLPIDECIVRVTHLLKTKELVEEAIINRIKELSEEEHLVIKNEKLYLPSLFYAEQGVVNHIERILSKKIDSSIAQSELLKIIGKIEEEENLNYGTEQLLAIQEALQSKVMILTGGPGTGKTTVIKGIIKAYALHNKLPYSIEDYKEKEEYPFILAAPTGRAAKRLEQSTGLPARTIHRLLGWNGEDHFEKNEYEQLRGKLLIIDEFSMVDIWLANNLLKAVPSNMQVLFVGDEDQLPSVGPGQVLSDFLQSKLIPTVRLQNIFRQQQGSKIIDLAHTIKNNTFNRKILNNDLDFSFIPCRTHQVIEVLTQIFERAQARGLDLKDLQVLAPMYRSEAGIDKINRHLQEIVNPKKHGKREKKIFDVTYRINDKVIQLVNQPEDGVSNGDIGEIVAIFERNETTEKKEQIVIKFDEKEVTYYRSDFQNFMHAYCISIHKAQGSEFPIVVLPIVSAYRLMLRKNLIYTAITRATSSLILCGEIGSIEQGIRTVDTNKRNSSLLDELLQIKELGKNTEELSPYDFME